LRSFHGQQGHFLVVVPTSAAASGVGVSAAELRARLQTLQQLVEECQRSTTPDHCQSDRVGSDLQLALPSGSRSIRFAWLRNLLDHAASPAGEKDGTSETVGGGKQPLNHRDTKDKAEKTPASVSKNQDSSNPSDSEDGESEDGGSAPPQLERPTLAQQLEEARKRLNADLDQIGSLSVAAQTGSQAGLGANPKVAAKDNSNPAADSSSQRQILARILAANEYHTVVAGPSLLDRLYERVENWIDRALAKLAQAGFKSKWVGYTAEIGFVLLICIGLVWFLMRLERQGRLELALMRSGPGEDTASARDWQLWLKDARAAAAQGAWRDAIHLLYWASISRLESSGQWPADRARTPREYLALLSPDSAQRPQLTRLTRSLEHTWYAGKSADEGDFRTAEEVAAKLGITPGTR
jgi:hypothetical protein